MKENLTGWGEGEVFLDSSKTLFVVLEWKSDGLADSNF